MVVLGDRFRMTDAPGFLQRKFMPLTTVAADVEIFDPPMCCPTGLCGPEVDQALLDVTEMVLALQETGIHVERYQMSTNPHAFLKNAEVMRLVREKELAALPIIVVRGKVVKVGGYPSLDEVRASLGERTV